MLRIISFNKHLHLLMAVLAIAFVCGGCVSDSLEKDASMDADGYITIHLRNAVGGTRATEADIDGLHENLIQSAYVCLYPIQNPEGKPAFVQLVSGINQNTTADLSIKLTAEIRGKLFPNEENTCGAYVIANPPSDWVPTVDMTLDNIKRQTVTSDFAHHTQESFVMDGTSEITRTGAGTANESASGTIDLKRCASKFTLAVKVTDRVSVGEGENMQEWEPQVENMSVLITDGLQATCLATAEYDAQPGDFYSTSTSAADVAHRQRPLENTGTGEFPYVLQAPFYTYPHQWNADDSDKRITYLTLLVPWRVVGTSEYRTCYYTIPVTPQGVTQIGRNISYRININVDMLGSFTPSEEFEVKDLSYFAVEWGSVAIDVDINDSRYLVLDQTEYTMENVSDIQIPVYTSHKTVVKDVALTYYRYNTTNAGIEQPITITSAQYKATQDRNRGNIYTCEFQNVSEANTDNKLVYDHELKVWEPYSANGNVVNLTGHSNQTAVNNAINSINYYQKTDADAFSRYVAKITLVHQDKIGQSDEANYTVELTITQYPQIYITSTQNVYNNGNAMSAAQGNMYCNGNQTQYGSNSKYWYEAYGLPASTAEDTNANPNQYVISITQLSPGANYVIGDPRVAEPTNLNGWKDNGYSGNWKRSFGDPGTSAPDMNWASAPGIEGGANRRLTNYYPTDESTAKARWVAPKIRIASSYGVSWNKSYDEDKARCASYQEMGYPAGRWRMPTVGEIEFIMKQSQEGKIPRLFNTNSYYMSAQGRVSTTFNENGELNTPTNTNGESAVRCVYDEWYWGDDVLKPNAQGKYTFTWGDRLKDDPQKP